MSSIETFYLIDFENVHEDGLSGSENLGSHDHVYLFYTKNSAKINIQKLTAFRSVHLSTFEIPNGNQSLDMHLVSCLGYLIGTNPNSKYKYIIVSKDTDYDNIISFWKEKKRSDIIRRNRISAQPASAQTARHAVVQTVAKPQAAPVANAPAKTPTKAPAKTSAKTAAKTSAKAAAKTPAKTSAKIPAKTPAKVSSNTRTRLNTEIQQALSKAKYPQTTIGKTASITVKHYGEDHFADNVLKELKAAYNNSAQIYEVISPILKRYSTASTKTTSSPPGQTPRKKSGGA
ncbi:MAG: PIN domain-containing protein [Muribaculum sp.]|nr:PIN domain-containing protein [Muribaculum sp.]